MNTNSYQVKVTGTLNEGVSRESAIEALSKLFKIPTEKAGIILSNAPMVVKKGIDQTAANKICQALNRIGIQNSVEQLAAPSTSDTLKQQQVKAVEE